MENNGDERVRSRAYELWEKDGRPDGRDKEHWSQAERETPSQRAQPTSDGAERDADDGAIVGMAAEVPVVRRKRTLHQSASGSGAAGAANVASSLPAGTSGRGDKPTAGNTRRGKNG
jgi:hypothetical protein